MHQRRSKSFVITAAIAALVGCASELESSIETDGEWEGSGSEADPVELGQPTDSDEALLDPISGQVGVVTTTRRSDGAFWYPPDLRVGGAALHPSGRVGVAFIEPDGTGRRVEYRQVDADPARSTYGTAVDGFTYALRGSASMSGVASTSVVRGDRTDGVFAVYDAGTIAVFEADGATGAASAPSTVRTSSVFGSWVLATPPAVEAGRFGGQSKVLLAYSSSFYNALTRTTYNSIAVGFLEKNTDGSYRLQGTGSVPVQPPGSPHTCSQPTMNIAAAFDSDHREWTVGWLCGNFALYLQRFDWNGVAVGSPFLVAWDPSDGIHSGVMLSFNKTVDQYLVQFQHGARIVRRYGDTYRCVDRLGNDVDAFACSSGDVADRLPRDRFRLGGVWASEVHYGPGAYFRVGSSCLDDGRCEGPEPRHTGVSYALEHLDEYWSDELETPSGWRREDGIVWPSDVDVALHRYVRVPALGRTALLHVDAPSTSSLGTVRVSFADEANVPVDE